MDNKERITPLEFDKNKKNRVIIRMCPTCGKNIKAHSEKQWEFVFKAHRTLSKKHEEMNKETSRNNIK